MKQKNLNHNIHKILYVYTYFSKLRQSLVNSSATIFFASLPEMAVNVIRKHQRTFSLMGPLSTHKAQKVFPLRSQPSVKGGRDGAVVEHLSPMQASHQCDPGSIPRLGVKCGLSLLLVLVLAPRGFSPGTPVFLSPQKPTFPNSN